MDNANKLKNNILFFDKIVDENMTKRELLEVIDFLTEENKRLGKERITPEEKFNREIHKKYG